MKHKYVMGNGLAFSEDKDVALMEKMAARGYALDGMVSYWYRFVKAEPEIASFACDISPLKPDTDEFAEYIAIFKSGGWEHVLSLGTSHWFKASTGTTPIYTGVGEREKFTRVASASLGGAIRLLLLGLAFAAIAVISTALLVRHIIPRWLGLVFIIIAFPQMGGFLGQSAVMFYGAILNRHRAAKTE
jgi:hypothetical protein